MPTARFRRDAHTARRPGADRLADHARRHTAHATLIISSPLLRATFRTMPRLYKRIDAPRPQLCATSQRVTSFRRQDDKKRFLATCMMWTSRWSLVPGKSQATRPAKRAFFVSRHAHVDSRPHATSGRQPLFDSYFGAAPRVTRMLSQQQIFSFAEVASGYKPPMPRFQTPG